MYYHVSYKPLKTGTLVPRIPRNIFTSTGKENDQIPRVCVSRTIKGALMALSRNIYRDVLHVYSVKGEGKKIIQSEDLKDKVPDAHLTEECWFLEEVEVVWEHKIFVIDMGDWFPYTFGKNEEGECLEWIYKVFETEDELLELDAKVFS